MSSDGFVSDLWKMGMAIMSTHAGLPVNFIAIEYERASVRDSAAQNTVPIDVFQTPNVSVVINIPKATNLSPDPKLKNISVTHKEGNPSAVVSLVLVYTTGQALLLFNSILTHIFVNGATCSPFRPVSIDNYPIFVPCCDAWVDCIDPLKPMTFSEKEYYGMAQVKYEDGSNPEEHIEILNRKIAYLRNIVPEYKKYLVKERDEKKQAGKRATAPGASRGRVQ